MVLPAVVETALSRYKRPVLTIKLREHKKTAYRINTEFYIPLMMVHRAGFEPTQNIGLQPIALPTELTIHMGAGVRVELTLNELMRLVSLPIGLSR